MTKRNITFSLNEDSYEAWIKIPAGKRSQFVEKSLGTFKPEVDLNPKGIVDLICLNNSTNSEQPLHKSLKHENKSYGTDRITRKKTRKPSYPKERDMTSLLSKL